MAADLEKKDIGDRFRVIEPPRLPEKPHSPNRRNLFMMALVVAMAASMGLAVLLELMDSSLRKDEDVTASLRLPVLATIPDLASGRSK